MTKFNNLFSKFETNKEFKLSNFPEGLTKFKSKIEFIFICFSMLTLILLAVIDIISLFNNFKIITLFKFIGYLLLIYLFKKLFSYSLRKLNFIKSYNLNEDRVLINHQNKSINHKYHKVFYTQDNEIPFIKIKKIIFDDVNLEAKVISHKTYFATFYNFKFINKSEYEKFKKEIQKCSNKNCFSKDFIIR